MVYTQEQLELIKQWASIYLPPKSMAAKLGIDAVTFRHDIHDIHNQASLYYAQGKADTQEALHTQEMALAKVGSPLALEAARYNLLAMEDDE